jgi:hypothetical protein
MSTIEQYSEIITRLVTEVLQCVPREWQHGTLTMNSDGKRLTYNLRAEDQPGKAVLSEHLRDLIDELYVRMAQHGNAWEQCVVTFKRSNGKVTFDTSFRHGQPGAPAPEPAPGAKPKKSWWSR